jgi:DNA modification methylase
LQRNELDKLICGDNIEILKGLDDNIIDLTVTSPPYFNLKEYSYWDSYDEYLKYIDSVFEQLYRVTKTGRFVCWNIQDNIPNPTKQGRKYYALMPDTVKIAQKYGFEWECNVIWEKNNATQLMLGSYPYPPTMIYRQTVESICIFRKFGKADLSNKKENDKLSKEEWKKYTKIVWDFSAQTKSEHPAPFPEELPKRLIKLHSFEGDLVLDPFVGSGTTCKVAKDLGRNYIGIDKEQNYIDIARDRLK